MPTPSASLKRHLQLLKELRGSGRVAPPRLAELKAWQSTRLHRTYDDVATQPRYRAATSFFLDDLYGPKDFSGRDQAMLRIVPVMTRILPASALETASLAIELEALSEDLDQRVAAALHAGPIDEEGYGAAYRNGSTRAERERQIELIVAVGERLDALVKKPMVARMLRLMRTPASVAGLQDLQEFLERGFEAFRAMHGAGDFLALVRSRETDILSRLFSGRSLASSPPRA
ncbi:MAG: hypothetical protein ABIR98_08855 [Usitatibacter sp.]